MTDQPQNIFFDTSKSKKPKGLTDTMRRVNEQYFINTLFSLKEGGTYIWHEYNFPFKRKGEKFVTTSQAIEAVCKVTSPAFAAQYFTTMKET